MAGTNGKTKSAEVMNRLVLNEIMSLSRSALIRRGDRRRSIDDECGFPSSIDPESYRDMYDRDANGERITNIFASESWAVSPTLYEDEDSETVTEFEEAWDALGKQLAESDLPEDAESFYEEEYGSCIWDYLERADCQSGIGTYGVIFFGLDDGMDTREPAEPRKDAKLIYLRTLDESTAQVAAYEQDRNNPRYGKPTRYLLTISDPRDVTQIGASNSTTLDVHWTRVQHIAEGPIWGIPRMKAVWNNLLNLQKLYGGSAEMYWQGAFPGLAIETNPNIDPSLLEAVDTADMKNQMEQYFNSLQRYLSLVGQTAKPLAPVVVDPTPQIDVQITAMCINKAVPKRIYMGSERGELASSQDERAWTGRMKKRQLRFNTPKIIVPFVDRLIYYGVLPKPKSYKLDWPDLFALSEMEQAELAKSRTESLVQYVSAQMEQLINPMDFLTRIMNFEEDEAEAMLDNTTKAIEGGETFTVPDADELEEQKQMERDQAQAQMDSLTMKNEMDSQKFE